MPDVRVTHDYERHLVSNRDPIASQHKASMALRGKTAPRKRATPASMGRKACGVWTGRGFGLQGEGKKRALRTTLKDAWWQGGGDTADVGYIFRQGAKVENEMEDRIG